MRVSTILYLPIIKFLKIRCGKNLCLYGLPVIVKNKGAELEIGDNCHIRSSFLSNLIGLYQRTIICARDKGKIFIGSGTGISGATIYARNEIQIGKNCIIGGNVKIIDNDFHPVNPIVRACTPCLNYGEAPITIGDNVFIGCNSLVLKGVTIGDNSVIGAGSVVSKDVLPNSLYAGNPARFIKVLD